ncbi:MAG: NAD-dependent epimerase/dehydratase family protein [Blastocatellia bacterium]|nr:NAD-dependent epimerase/dehydratase family protein [Blastocatellia bacterium]
MKKVLVTGANGHVGNILVRLLVDRGYQVRASVRDANKKDLTQPLAGLPIEIVSADIMKPETLANATKGMDGVFQVAAAYTTISDDPQRDILDPSIIGGINVLQACKDAGVKKVVFTSSIAAVGSDGQKDNPLNENNWNDKACSPYMVAKTQAEKKAWDFAKKNNLNLVTICPSGVLGPGFYRHTPTTQPFELALRGQVPAVPRFGLGYVDVRDVATAHLLAYENDKAEGRYIATDQCFWLKDVLALAKEIDDRVKLPLIEIPVAVAGIIPLFDWLGYKLTGAPRQITSEMLEDFNGKAQYISSERIKKELGWKPMDIKQSIKDTLDWIHKTFINKN